MRPTIDEVRPNVLLVKYEAQEELCSSFMRMQEFYESPFPNIRGTFFTTEEFKDTYERHGPSGKFTYSTDWSGFNLPNHIIESFMAEKFAEDLNDKERVLVECIQNAVEGKERYYIIGVYGDRTTRSTHVKHELAHAYWYLYPEYKTKVKAFLDEMREAVPEAISALERNLLERGYDDVTLEDELNAYLATSSRSYLEMHLGIDINTEGLIPLRNFFAEFNEQFE